MRPLLELARKRLKDKKAIAVMSSKGGVGKSMISSLIALNLSEKKKTALVDLDIYGSSISKLFGIDKLHEVDKDGIKPLVIDNLSIFSLGGLVGDRYIVLPGKYEGDVVESFLGFSNIKEDFLVIDMPPGMGEEILTLRRILNPEILLVTLPSKLSVKTVKQMLDYLVDSGSKPKAILVNMAFLRNSNGLYPFGEPDDVYELGKNYEINVRLLPFDPSVEEFIGRIQNYSGVLRIELRKFLSESEILK